MIKLNDKEKDYASTSLVKPSTFLAHTISKELDGFRWIDEIECKRDRIIVYYDKFPKYVHTFLNKDDDKTK